MDNPTDKPDFDSIAFQFEEGFMGCELAGLLSEIYEEGYHVGLIYGWGLEQDKERAAENQPDPFEPL